MMKLFRDVRHGLLDPVKSLVSLQFSGRRVALRRLSQVLMVVFLTGSLFAQETVQHGVYLSDIDRSADPCTDFYQYSNGAWRTANPIPASMLRWSRRWAAGEQSKDQLKAVLEEASSKHDWPRGSVDQLIGDFYGSCMDETRIDQLGFKPLQPWFASLDGMKNATDLQREIRRLHDVNVSVPFNVGSTTDNHNPTLTIADVGAGGLGLPDRDYYFKTEARFQEAREKYQIHVVNMFKLVGYDEANAKAAASTVFQMEKNLAGASLDNVALRDPQATDHRTTFADLQKLAPAVEWKTYFESARIPTADINVDQPKFLEEVDRQLRNVSLADWKTYLKWQLLQVAASFLSRPLVEENFNFYGHYLGGAQEMKPRWKLCVETGDQLLGEALGKKYVEKYFSAAAKARVQEMVKNLLAAMHDTIETRDWMGAETRKKALEKLATFNPKIGYPDKWKDYSKVGIRRDSFWDNVEAGAKFNVDDDRAQIGKPTDRGRWGMTPPTSDAYYNALKNEIVFPAGILQAPAFRMDAVDAVNYGAIGVVIGHEISHGFDDSGAQFDALGRLNNWWTADDLKQFQERTACVVRQFDGYFIEPNIHHNGNLVLGESIGDLGGAKIAYLAFKKSQEGKPPAPAIDGFTPDQQFFIAWGQFRGDAIRPETQRTMVQGDPHPIGKYRVIGPLSNMTQFQETFQCKAGSPMVRPTAERCEVW